MGGPRWEGDVWAETWLPWRWASWIPERAVLQAEGGTSAKVDPKREGLWYVQITARRQGTWERVIGGEERERGMGRRSTGAHVSTGGRRKNFGLCSGMGNNGGFWTNEWLDLAYMFERLPGCSLVNRLESTKNWSKENFIDNQEARTITQGELMMAWSRVEW